jgi:hypothetical protein
VIRQVVFDTKQVVLTWVGDAAGCRLEASDPAWSPFAEVVTALFAREAPWPVDLAALSVPNVAIARAERDASDGLRAFWARHLGWTEAEPPIGYWSFLRPGTDDGALMPDLAIGRWLAVAREAWAAAQEELDLQRQWDARCRAAQALVDRWARTVDWSSEAPRDLVEATAFPDGTPRDPDAPPVVVPVLDAVEARAANFDVMIPTEPVTHVAREHVLLAIAAAGVLDPPDDGRRDRALAGRPTLRGWRAAALAWYDARTELPALSPPGCTHPLASPLALDWFRTGPYAGEDHSPADWLRWHLANWREELRTAPGHFDLFARALSGRVSWQTGVAELQQLRSAGRREEDLPWAARCTVRAAVCTKNRAPAVGVALAAALAAAEPGNWHGWIELGVALGELGASGFAVQVPFEVGGKPLDRYGAAGGARACLRRAVALHPPLKGASVIGRIENDLEENRIFHDQPPVPLEAFPAALVAGVRADGLRAAFEALPAPLRRYVLSGGFPATCEAIGALADGRGVSPPSP